MTDGDLKLVEAKVEAKMMLETLKRELDWGDIKPEFADPDIKTVEYKLGNRVIFGIRYSLNKKFRLEFNLDLAGHGALEVLGLGHSWYDNRWVSFDLSGHDIRHFVVLLQTVVDKFK